MARKRKSAKPARRKPGTGTIRHRPERDKPWEAAFPIGRNEYRHSAFVDRSQAEEWLGRLTTERDHAETPRNIARGSMRVDAFLTMWLNIRAPHLSPKTIIDYTYQCNLAVNQWAARRIDEIERSDADNLLLYYHRKGRKNLGQLRMVLRQAFEYALEEDWLRRNPFARAKAPPVERKEVIALSVEQRDQLLEHGAVEDIPAVPLAPLWHLYSRLGFRRGEGMGLRWGDIDWRAGTVTIAQQYTGANGKTIKRPPKTKRARRSLPLPPDVLALLERHKASQRKHAAGDPDWVEHGLVFPDKHGAPLKVNALMYRWELLRKRASLPEQLTIHGLRHTALTILEKGGAPVSIVQSIAGHASSSMTRHYVDHTTVEDMRRAING